MKEDAILPILAVSIALLLNGLPRRRGAERAIWLIAPVALAFANLGVYYTVVVPAVAASGVPAYANFWSAYGATPIHALGGMAAAPLTVAASLWHSGFFARVIVPHLYLPLAGWRWAAGIVPMVLLFSASADPQLQAIGIYYSMLLMPFLVIGASAGALVVARRLVRADRAPWLAAAAILAGAVLVGSGDRGYSLRPWRAETAAVADALEQLRDERAVLVQSGLYPHAGYDARIQLLTPWTLTAPEFDGAALLIAPHVPAYPFTPADIEHLAAATHARPLASGLVAVRRPGDDGVAVRHALLP